jgi:hypothetical protein
MKSNGWPSAWKDNFENIRKIRDQKLDSFCANIDTRGLEALQGLSSYRLQFARSLIISLLHSLRYSSNRNTFVLVL